MRIAAIGLAVVLAAFAAGASTLLLRDGTVIEAASVTVTGSYVILTLSDGRQVAYDVADVDPASLAPTAVVEEAGAGTTSSPSLGGLSGGLMLEERQGESAIRITDQDVEHVRPAGTEPGGADEVDESGGEIPEGFTEGGSVSLNNIEIVPLEEGQWRVTGEVVNRSQQVAQSVRIKLEIGGPSPSNIDFGVTSSLPPDERAVFEHVFRAEVEAGQSQPLARVRVIWMQPEAPRREPAEPRYGQGGPPVPDVVSRQPPPLG